VSDDSRAVALWTGRARAYHELTRRYDLFTRIAERLFDGLPSDFEGNCVDLGGGSGLASRLLLDRHPRAAVTLTDPVAEMLELARETLGSRVEYELGTASTAALRKQPVDFFFSNAAAHLFADEEQVFAAVSRSLRPGGRYAFNLWAHSYAPTQDAHAPFDWRRLIDRACDAESVARVAWPERPRARVPSPPGPRLPGRPRWA